MRLFDLIEEDDGVRPAADLLRELTGLVIADIARGRADHARNRELLHELRHIEPDERLGRVEELIGEALDELRLADAGAADEQEAHGLALGLQADAIAADGGTDGIDRRILPDDVRAQAVAETGELLKLICADARGRDLRPELDDAREVIRRKLRAALGAQRVKLGLQLHLAAAQLGDARIAVLELLIVIRVAALRRCRGQQLALARIVADLLFDLVGADEVGIFQVHVRAGLVNEVDGLVRQKAVGDIALAEHDGKAAHGVRDDDAVKVLIIAAHALEDLDAVVDARLGHRDGLEAALERRVFFDVLAVLGKRRRADDLDLTAREGGLEDVGGVHAALGVTRADDVVHLVDDEDDVADAADLLDEPLHAALELTAELRARHERREVEQVDLLVAQLIRHIALGDALGKPLGDGRLADAGLADETGVVLLAAVEDLDDALQLLRPADHGVKLAVAGALREIDTVVREKLQLARGTAALVGSGGILPRLLRRLRVGRRGRVLVKEAVQKRERRGLAVVLVRVGVGGVGVRVRVAAEHAHAAEHLRHVAGEVVKVGIRDAELFHHLIDGLDVQLARAAQAQSLIVGLAVFDSCDKDHRYIFLAAGAECRLHRLVLLFDRFRARRSHARAEREHVDDLQRFCQSGVRKRVAADDGPGKLQCPAQQDAKAHAAPPKSLSRSRFGMRKVRFGKFPIAERISIKSRKPTAVTST